LKTQPLPTTAVPAGPGVVVAGVVGVVEAGGAVVATVVAPGAAVVGLIEGGVDGAVVAAGAEVTDGIVVATVGVVVATVGGVVRIRPRWRRPVRPFVDASMSDAEPGALEPRVEEYSSPAAVSSTTVRPVRANNLVPIFIDHVLASSPPAHRRAHGHYRAGPGRPYQAPSPVAVALLTKLCPAGHLTLIEGRGRRR
jgi:hypothetical protein